MYNMYVRRYFGGWYLFRFFLFLFILNLSEKRETRFQKRERESSLCSEVAFAGA